MDSFKLLPVFFIGIFAAQFLIKLLFEWALEILKHSPQGPWQVQLMGGLTDLIISFVLLMAYGFAIQNLEHTPKTLSQFFQDTLGPLASESLLAFSHIIVGVILFIIPGVIFYVFYVFLPYVVFYHPEYHTGKISALQESKKLVKCHFFLVFFLLIITGIISITLELGSNLLNLTAWWQELFFFVFSFYFTGFSFMLFYGLYQQLSQKNEPKNEEKR